MRKYKFLYCIPAVVWMIVIFILSSMTGSDLQNTFPFFSDFNWGHFVAYFILGITYYFALFQRIRRPKIFYIIIILAVLYGITDEFHQFFVPTRVPDVKDLFADGIGASLASMVLIIVRKTRKVQLPNE